MSPTGCRIPCVFISSTLRLSLSLSSTSVAFSSLCLFLKGGWLNPPLLLLRFFFIVFDTTSSQYY